MGRPDTKTATQPPGSRTPALAGVTRRSGVTNGKRLLLGLRCGNEIWHRRLSDIVALHTADLGGSDLMSESEKVLVRRAAMLTLQAELMEQRWAENGGEASEKSLICYQRCVGGLRRIWKTLGLERRTKDVTPPTLHEYLRSKSGEDSEADAAEE